MCALPPTDSFSLTLGKFGDAKAGVYASTGDDVTAAQAKREEVSAPDGVPTLVHDFPLKNGYDGKQLQLPITHTCVYLFTCACCLLLAACCRGSIR